MHPDTMRFIDRWAGIPLCFFTSLLIWKNKKTGKKIPRLIINKITVTFNGKEVVSADLHPAIAANPYFAFNYKVVESGTFKFMWTDDKGKTVTVEKSLKAG